MYWGERYVLLSQGLWCSAQIQDGPWSGFRLWNKNLLGFKLSKFWRHPLPIWAKKFAIKCAVLKNLWVGGGLSLKEMVEIWEPFQRKIWQNQSRFRLFLRRHLGASLLPWLRNTMAGECDCSHRSHLLEAANHCTVEQTANLTGCDIFVLLPAKVQAIKYSGSSTSFWCAGCTWLHPGWQWIWIQCLDFWAMSEKVYYVYIKRAEYKVQVVDPDLPFFVMSDLVQELIKRAESHLWRLRCI